MKWTTEAKVGAFTIIGIALFIAGILFVGRIDIWAKPQMTITGDFAQVNGLKNGNQVKYSGVAIGNVSDIEITPHGVVVKMKLDEKTQIPSDSIFTLGSDGFLGDKFIQISPGHSTVYLQDGDSVKGEGADAMDKAMQSAQKLMDGTEKMLQSINNIIGDPATQNAITQNMADVTAQLNQAAQQFNADGNAGNDMRAILTNLKQTTDRVDNMARSMESTVTDPKAQENIKETLHNTAQISARINKLMGGKAYQTDTNGNIVEVGTTEKKSSPKVEPSVDLLYNTTDNEFRINGRVRAYNDKGMAELGLSNIGDGTKFDLNAGRFISSKWLVRGGIFESELGLGVDYNLRGPVSLSAAVYDLNNRKYRIRSDIRLHKDTYGVIQMTRPFGSTNGGTYFGIKQVF